MAFVNEYVSQDEIQKYGLGAIDKRYFRGDYKTQWTRDHARDIYLRHMRNGGEEGIWQQTFTFYWKGTLIEVGLAVRGDGEKNGKELRIWGLRYISIPNELEEYREEILSDLRDALMVYGVAGLIEPSTNFTISCEF